MRSRRSVLALMASLFGLPLAGPAAAFAPGPEIRPDRTGHRRDHAGSQQRDVVVVIH